MYAFKVWNIEKKKVVNRENGVEKSVKDFKLYGQQIQT